jgi:hypothetical protein
MCAVYDCQNNSIMSEKGFRFIGNETGKLEAIRSGSALINDLEDFVAW